MKFFEVKYISQKQNPNYKTPGFVIEKLVYVTAKTKKAAGVLGYAELELLDPENPECYRNPIINECDEQEYTSYLELKAASESETGQTDTISQVSGVNPIELFKAALVRHPDNINVSDPEDPEFFFNKAVKTIKDVAEESDLTPNFTNFSKHTESMKRLMPLISSVRVFEMFEDMPELSAPEVKQVVVSKEQPYTIISQTGVTTQEDELTNDQSNIGANNSQPNNTMPVNNGTNSNDVGNVQAIMSVEGYIPWVQVIELDSGFDVVFGMMYNGQSFMNQLNKNFSNFENAELNGWAQLSGLAFDLNGQGYACEELITAIKNRKKLLTIIEESEFSEMLDAFDEANIKTASKEPEQTQAADSSIVSQQTDEQKLLAANPFPEKVTAKSHPELFKLFKDECDFDTSGIPKHGKGYVLPEFEYNGKLYQYDQEVVWDYSWGIEEWMENECAFVLVTEEPKVEEKPKVSEKRQQIIDDHNNLSEAENKIKLQIEELNIRLNELELGEILILDDIPNEVYHGTIGYSSTNIKDELISSKWRHGLETGAIEQSRGKHFDFGNYVHSLLLQPHTIADEYSFEPVRSENCLEGIKQLKEVIEMENANREPLATNDELKSMIDEHNATLPSKLGIPTGAAEIKERYHELPDEFKTLDESVKQTSASYGKCIRAYNDTLPTKLKNTGKRDALLDSIKIFDFDFVENEINKKPTLPTSGTLKDLADRIRSFNPDYEFAHELQEQWEKEVEETGKIPVSQGDIEHAKNIVNSVLNNPAAKEFFGVDGDDVACERSYFWIDPATGLLLKARLDKEVGPVIIDLKTIEVRRDIKKKDLRAYLFNEIIKRGYHISAKHYLNGTAKQVFVWVFVNKVKGYEFEAVIQATPEHLELGQYLLDDGLYSIQESTTSGVYPGPIEHPVDEEGFVMPIQARLTVSARKQLQYYRELNRGEE